MELIFMGKWGRATKLSLPIGVDIAVYKNDAGEDWYEKVAHNPDSPAGTAIGVDETGRVRAHALHLGQLTPDGLEVYVVPDWEGTSNEENDELFKYNVEDGKLVLRPEQIHPVTSAQAKHALYNAGLLDDVEALISGNDYRPMNIWFAGASNWTRDHAYVQAMALELGLSDEQVDELFKAAGKL